MCNSVDSRVALVNKEKDDCAKDGTAVGLQPSVRALTICRTCSNSYKEFVGEGVSPRGK